LEKLQDTLSREDTSLEYIPCESARAEDACDKIQPDDVIIWTPQIGKKMIVAAARGGRVFAPKTTRHLIPARPLNINIPSHWLKEDVSLDDINKRFANYLTAKRIRKFGPGQVIDGRYYGETLFVFYDWTFINLRVHGSYNYLELLFYLQAAETPIFKGGLEGICHEHFGL